MKLKEFDFKLPSEDKKQKNIILASLSVITIILLITIASTFAYYQSIDTQNPINTSVGEFSSGDVILAVTIDGVESQSFPTKGSGYMVSDIVCDKGAVGEWDYIKWGIIITSLSQPQTKCNVAFIEDEDGIGTLAYEIKQQGGGASAIEAKGNPAFNAIPTAQTSGIYATEDEYGTSYYYRGERDLLNNNIIFAGFQWKIVRINGDSSVRIIYNGTEAQFNSVGTMNTTGSNTRIGESAFNANSNDNKYLGYMYGGAAGVASTTITQAQTNQTNSTIKTYIDAWYVNNIVSKGITITNSLADNLFCNDRQLGRDYPGAPTTGSGWDGTGFGTSLTYYSSYYRHYENRSNPTPTLKCAQKNDRFTVSDTVTGNGDLIYPVGLITADEIAYGGTTVSYYNTNQYLSTSQHFWSLSSREFLSGGHAVAWFSNSTGTLGNNLVYFVCGVRPLLNLKPDVIVTSGDGSALYPFKVAI